MSLSAPTCPSCHTPLTLTTAGEFHPWMCSGGHGLAMTLSAGYGKLQEDELAELWVKARKSGTPGFKACPMCEKTMVQVDADFDADEAREGDPGDGPATGTVPLDVCTVCEVLWFDAGEVDQFPGDLENPKPTAEENAHLAEITQTFSQNLGAAMAETEASQLTNRIANHLYGHRHWFGFNRNKAGLF